jgi:pimeloyl-ACP methyl ester carboxylesterase
MKIEVRGDGPPLVYLHAAGGVRWTPVLENLAQTRTVHMPTLPGFDGTPALSGMSSRRDLARLAGDYIESKIGAACDVFGCSFGGAVALWLAADRPGCVDHLVLECPDYGAQEGKDSELMENLEKIQATTLILHGTEDRIIRADSMRLLKRRLGRAFLVYVWDAAHNLEMDQPERVLALVQSFLERSEAFVVAYA